MANDFSDLSTMQKLGLTLSKGDPMDYLAQKRAVQKNEALAKIFSGQDGRTPPIAGEPVSPLSRIERAAQIDPETYAPFLARQDIQQKPSSLREYEAYIKMSPEEKADFRSIKRGALVKDIGGKIVTLDPQGNVIGEIKKGLTPSQDPEYIKQVAIAKDEGQKYVLEKGVYDELRSTMPGLKDTMSELKKLTADATYTYLGQGADAVARQVGVTTKGALDRTAYNAIVSNQILPLLRQTFGAAFTAKEGDTLRATLGDPNKSPEEKNIVIESFIAQKERDIESQARKLGFMSEGSKSKDAPQANASEMSDEELMKGF